MRRDDLPWPGEPEAIWDASSQAPAVPRPPAPDLSTFESYTRHLRVTRPGALFAILSTVLGIGALVLAVVFYRVRPAPSDIGSFGDLVFEAFRWNWLIAAVVGVWFLAWGPLTVRRDRHDHPDEVCRDFAAARDRGMVCRGFSTGFQVYGDDGRDPTFYAIDAAVDDARAARLQWSFTAWLDVLSRDGDAESDARRKHDGRRVVPSEELFGPDAVGGFLVRGHYHFGRWWLIVRPDPESDDAVPSWSIERVHDGAPV